MIISFTVGNYKLFKDKVSLNMNGASISKITDTHIIDAGKFKLLKSVGIYGANASGKSKLLAAMEFMQNFVVNSSKNTQANEQIDVDPFRLNTETLTKASFFEMEFLLNGVCYRYGFEVTKNHIESEWLFYRPKNLVEKPLFGRLKDEIEIFSPAYKEGRGVEERTRSNALFLSSVAQWNGVVSQDIVNWFDKLYFFDSTSDYYDETETLELLSESKYKKLIEKMVKIADLDIESVEALEYKEIISKKTGKKMSLSDTYEHLVTYHKVYDKEGKEVTTTLFEMEEDESLGTRKFFSLLGVMINVLERGEVLISDEIDSRLHSRLMQAIVLLFNSNVANKKGSQLIFTTHDTNLIDSNFLSRDQIYFLEKNKFGTSKLYSLLEFKTRKGVNHEKEYFKGRYGAIPFISNFEEAFQNIK